MTAPTDGPDEGQETPTEPTPDETPGAPPLPPPAYGQYGTPETAPPPPGQYGAPSPYGGQPQTSQYAGAQLASWGRRVGGYLLDVVIFGIPVGIIDAVSGSRVVADVLSILVFLTIGYLNGAQGQTPGKRIVGIKLVRDADGALLGAGLGIVREICHFLDSLACLIGWLWPLWDSKNQTFADKLMSTVVLKI